MTGRLVGKPSAFDRRALEPPGRLLLTACLEPSASLLERILATIANSIFVCDRAGQLLHLNPLGARLLGLELSTALQQMIHAFAFTPELQAKLTLQLEVVFTTGRSITSAMSFLTPANGLRDYKYALSPIQGTMEHIEAVVCHTQQKSASG